MRNILSIIILLYSLTSACQEQDYGFFSAMVTDSNYIYALHKSGRLNVWDIKTLKKVYSQNDTLPKYTAISKDRNGAIFLASSKGFVYKLISFNNYTTPVYKYKEDKTVHYLVFNPDNEIFLIIEDGIYSVKKDRTYSEFLNTGFSAINYIKYDENGVGHVTNTFFSVPQTILCDSEGLLWMSKRMGEFGSTRNIFDTNTGKIIGEVPEVSNIQSFIEGPHGITFITSGLQHKMNFGAIYKVDANIEVTQVYDSNLKFDGTKATINEMLFIGPGAWNQADNRLYFSSSDGFYSAAVSPAGKLIDVKKLFTPTLTAYRENLAIGYQMPINEVSFTYDNRLIFRTAGNGIGIYNGNELIILK